MFNSFHNLRKTALSSLILPTAFYAGTIAFFIYWLNAPKENYVVVDEWELSDEVTKETGLLLNGRYIPFKQLKEGNLPELSYELLAHNTPGLEFIVNNPQYKVEVYALKSKEEESVEADQAEVYNLDHYILESVLSTDEKRPLLEYQIQGTFAQQYLLRVVFTDPTRRDKIDPLEPLQREYLLPLVNFSKLDEGDG